jgi:hypothetical protein
MSRPPKVAIIVAAVAAAFGMGSLLAFGPLGLLRDSPAAKRVPPAPIASTSTTTTIRQGVTPMASGWVKVENAKPGTPNWRLTKPSRTGEIEGYASAVSAQRGDAVSLYVSSKTPTYTLALYRMGYYGGAGGRLVWASPTEPGVVQPTATVTPVTNMVEAPWAPSLRITIDPSWPPGDYLFKLVAADGYDNYIPLTVRDDESTAGLLINNSVTTWQAYNLWGGYDLYEGRSGGGSSFAHRARIVSFDRPYKIGDGSGDFLGNEFPFVSLAESTGVDLSYTTDVDLDLHPELLLRHHALISLGHDEYWSTKMRDGVEAARSHGVNVAFLGANAVFRHIRFATSSLGPTRHEIDYKSAGEDPLLGLDNAEVTPNSWRDSPNNRPENTLLGELYQCNPVSADLVVFDPSAWIYDGTGLNKGDRIRGLVGSEYDQFVPGIPGPKNVEVMAHSPLRCRGTPNFSDMTYYTDASGAGVIDSGTNNWVPFLTDPSSQPALVRITENILTVFATGPAGVAHPSVPNTAGLPRPVIPRNIPPDTPSATVKPTPTSKPTVTTIHGATTPPTVETTPPTTGPPPTTNPGTTTPT